MAGHAYGDWLAQRALVFGRGKVTQVAGDQNVYLPGSGPAPRAPAALPAGAGRLVGRDGEVGELLGLLDPRRPGPPAVVRGRAARGR